MTVVSLPLHSKSKRSLFQGKNHFLHTCGGIILELFNVIYKYLLWKSTEPPQVSTFPAHNIDLTEGESFTLRCDATGKPVPSMFWKKLKAGPNGEIIYTLKDLLSISMDHSYCLVEGTALMMRGVKMSPFQDKLLLKNMIWYEIGIKDRYWKQEQNLLQQCYCSLQNHF